MLVTNPMWRLRCKPPSLLRRKTPPLLRRRNPPSLVDFFFYPPAATPVKSIPPPWINPNLPPPSTPFFHYFTSTGTISIACSRTINAHFQRSFLHRPYSIRGSNCYCSWKSQGDYPRSMFQNLSKESAQNLFDEMSERKPMPSVKCFNSLLSGLANIKDYKLVIHFFKEIVEKNISVNPYTLSIVIRSCCEISRTKDGFVVLGLGLKWGIKPDNCIYNYLLMGLVKESRLGEAELFFRVLLVHNCMEPDIYTYSILVTSLCKRKVYKEALNVLDIMERKGLKPSVNMNIYGTIIDSLCKDKQIETALVVFKEMAVRPNVFVYTSLIRCLGVYGMWHEAKNLWREMHKDMISPDVNLYSILVHLISKEGKVDEALEMVNHMIAKGMEPNVVTYSPIVYGYCASGDMGKGREVLNSMKSRGITPNTHCLNILLNGYWKESRIEEAIGVFSEITEPDLVSYNTMMQGLFASRNPIQALELFSMLQGKNIKPTQATFRIVIGGLCKNNRFNEAMKLFNSSLYKELASDVVIYNILISHASRLGNLESAKMLFKDLTENGLKPSEETFAGMITGLIRAGLMTEAELLVVQMEKEGVQSTSLTYNLLMNGFLQHKQFTAIDKCINEMVRRGLTLDSETFALLIQPVKAGLLDASLIQLILKLAPKMEKEASQATSVTLDFP